MYLYLDKKHRYHKMDHLDSGSTDIVNILKLNSKAIFAYKPIKDMILPLTSDLKVTNILCGCSFQFWRMNKFSLLGLLPPPNFLNLATMPTTVSGVKPLRPTTVTVELSHCTLPLAQQFYVAAPCHCHSRVKPLRPATGTAELSCCAIPLAQRS